MPDDSPSETITKKAPSPVKVSLVVGGLLIGGVIFHLVSLLFLKVGFWHDLFHSAGEAPTVAFLLGVIGDFYLRFRLSEDSIQRGVQAVISDLFGFLDPAQPRPLREAVKAFAKQLLYATDVNWTITFEWADDERKAVKVLIYETHTAHNLNPDGLAPHGRAWILESTPGKQSDFLSYRLICSQDRIDEDIKIEEMGAYVRRHHGRAELNLERFWNHKGNGRRIQYGHHYTASQESLVYRDGASSLPLTLPMFAIHLGIRFDGPALNDLSFSVLLPRSEQGAEEPWRFDGRTARPIQRDWRGVTPWQAIILSWWRTPGPEVDGVEQTRMTSQRQA